MNRIEVDVTGLSSIARDIELLGPVAERAGLSAINKAARFARTRASQAIRAQVNLPARRVNKGLEVIPARRGGLLESVVQAAKRPVLLRNFAARQLTKRNRTKPGRKRAGFSVKVKRGGARKKLRQAFPYRLKRGRARGEGVEAIAIRTGPNRQDIKVLYGPSVDQVYRSVRAEIAPAVREQLRIDYERDLRFFINRSGTFRGRGRRR